MGRLTEAAYSTGECFLYEYDSVGNRELSISTTSLGGTITNTYSYDDANRLTYVNSTPLSWDDNGNLLEDQDGTEYHYDSANRLVRVEKDGTTYEYAYNGFGHRLSQTVGSEVTTYTLNIVGSLTQVLDDGTATYLYGLGRISEIQDDDWFYHLTDALGSVRQLADADAWIVLTRSFEPFGDLLDSEGDVSTIYGFSGEQIDGTGLVYLRARYLDPGVGRFLTEDPSPGYSSIPSSLNIFAYVWNNPVNLRDSRGLQVNAVPCKPGEICASGTVGGQVSQIGILTPIPQLYISDQGWWEIFIYKRSSSVSLYLEVTDSLGCKYYPGIGGELIVEDVHGVQWTGSNFADLAGQIISESQYAGMQFAEFYSQNNYRAAAGAGTEFLGTASGYIEASFQNEGLLGDWDNTELSLNTGIEVEALKSLSLSAEMGSTAGMNTLSLESSWTPSFNIGPVERSVGLTGGVSCNSSNEKWVVVPTKVKKLYPNENDLAKSKFRDIVGRDSTDPLDWYLYDRRWRNDFGATQFYLPFSTNVRNIFVNLIQLSNDQNSIETPFFDWEAW